MERLIALLADFLESLGSLTTQYTPLMVQQYAVQQWTVVVAFGAIVAALVALLSVMHRKSWMDPDDRVLATVFGTVATIILLTMATCFLAGALTPELSLIQSL